MLVETVDGMLAECVARSCKRIVSLVLLDEQDAVCGAHVLVHQGLALRVVSAEEAASIWEAFDLATAPRGGGQEAGV
jgi:hydrogenase assembly chaperone HypC/HupF